MGKQTDETPGAQPLVAIWRYRVKKGKLAAFMRAYGPDGTWVELFRKAEGYQSTDLLRDEADPVIFVTIDHWVSREAYDAFRMRFADEYLALDTLCAGCTEDEELLLEGYNQGRPPGS